MEQYYDKNGNLKQRDALGNEYGGGGSDSEDGEFLNTGNKILDPLNLFGKRKGETPQKPQGVSYPGKNTALYSGPSDPNSIYQNQRVTAINYRKGLADSVKKDSDTLYGDYAADSRQALTQGIKDSRAGYNNRGLLNSGKRLSSEYGARAASQKDLASARYNINKSLLDSRTAAADQMENNQLNTGYAYAGGSPNLGYALNNDSQNKLNQDITDYQGQQQLYAAAGNGLSNLATSMFSNKNKNSGDLT